MKKIFLPLLICGLLLAGCDSAEDDQPVIIEDLVVGTGKVAGLDSLIQVEYDAMVQGGDTFLTDATLQEPTILGSLIEGWVEGLEGMKVGGVRKLTVPPSKAFGSREVVDDSLNLLVPANSTVIFDIELTGVGPRPVEIVDIATGTGDEISLGSSISVTYVGSLSDGRVFDETPTGPSTFLFDYGSLIEGWIIGLQGMREGGRRQLVIPSELGYSDQEVCFDPQRVCADENFFIPAFSTLHFDVELVEVN